MSNIFFTGFEAGVIITDGFPAGYSIAGVNFAAGAGRLNGVCFQGNNAGTSTLTLTTPAMATVHASMYLCLGTAPTTNAIFTWGTIAIRLPTTTTLTISVSGSVVATLTVPAIPVNVWRSLRITATLGTGAAGYCFLEWDGVSTSWTGNTTSTTATSMIIALQTQMGLDDVWVNDTTVGSGTLPHNTLPDCYSCVMRRPWDDGVNAQFALKGIRTIPTGFNSTSFLHGFAQNVGIDGFGDTHIALNQGQKVSTYVAENTVGINQEPLALLLTSYSIRNAYCFQSVYGTPWITFVDATTPSFPQLKAVNTATNAVVTVISGSSGYMMAVTKKTSNGYVYLALGSGTISRFPVTTMVTPTTVTPATGTALVGTSEILFSDYADCVWQLRNDRLIGYTSAMVAITPIVTGATAVANSMGGWVDSGAGTVCVVSGTNLIKFNASTRAMVAVVPLGRTVFNIAALDTYNGCNAVAYDPTGDRVFVACTDGTVLSVFYNTGTAAWEVTAYGSIPVPSTTMVALEVHGGYLFAASSKGINAYNLTTNTLASYSGFPSTSNTGQYWMRIGNSLYTRMLNETVVYDLTTQAFATPLMHLALAGFDTTLSTVRAAYMTGAAGQRHDFVLTEMPMSGTIGGVNLITANSTKESGGPGKVKVGVRTTDGTDVFAATNSPVSSGTGSITSRKIMTKDGTNPFTFSDMESAQMILMASTT